ncbi:Plug domain-containing protein, partial [Acinetobacter baumannii]
RDRKGATLGETVGDEAGVHNASFGTGVGLPVIRGLSGARVKVLSNGGGTHDATTFSPDHASTADTAVADSVRILRGPATIRYGGGAIGGVV